MITTITIASIVTTTLTISVPMHPQYNHASPGANAKIGQNQNSAPQTCQSIPQKPVEVYYLDDVGPIMFLLIIICTMTLEMLIPTVYYYVYYYIYFCL